MYRSIFILLILIASKRLPIFTCFSACLWRIRARVSMRGFRRNLHWLDAFVEVEFKVHLLLIFFTCFILFLFVLEHQFNIGNNIFNSTSIQVEIFLHLHLLLDGDLFWLSSFCDRSTFTFVASCRTFQAKSFFCYHAPLLQLIKLYLETLS